MIPIAITILYEDQQGPNRDFGLHRFVMACVFDSINGDRYKVEGCVECRPLKGNSKLLESARKDSAKIARDGRQVIAVFDNDEIRRLLKLSANASDDDVKKAIRDECEDGSAPTVALLKQNAETLITAAKSCASGQLVEENLFERALRKELPARDLIFKRIAKDAERDIRDCILRAVPSVTHLVAMVADLLRLPPL